MGRRRGLLKKFSETNRWPIITCILIGILVVVFAIQQLVPMQAWLDYTLIPVNALSKPWTFVTYFFMHSSIEHLTVNLMFLTLFGYYVEVTIGRKGLLTSFFLAGFVGGLVGVLVAQPQSAIIGSSAAVLGIAGFLAAISPDYPVRLYFLPIYRPAIVPVMFYALINFLFLFTSNSPVAYVAHLIGLGVGILLGLYWRRFVREET